MAQFLRTLRVAGLFLPFFVATSALGQPASAGKSSSASGSGMKLDGSGASYTVEFSDDPLNSLNDGLLIPRIVVRPGPLRTMLLRPRTSFVTELLKSVELM